MADKIVNSFSRDIDTIEKQSAKEQGKLFGQMAFEGGKNHPRSVTKYNIQCDQKMAAFAAMNEKQMGHLRHQKQLWESHGHVNQLELPRCQRHSRCGKY